jgi:hypothetical protein
MVRKRAVGRWTACLLAVAAACVSCTGAPSQPARPSPPAPVPGELLGVTGTQASTSLVRYRLPDGPAETFAAPIDPEALNRSALAGVSTPDGSLFVTAVRRAAQVYELAAGASDPSPLGPPLAVRTDEPMLSVGERAVVVADCASVRILALPDARRWVTVGQGCWGAVSPDGRSVVVAPDGRRVVEVSPSGDGRGEVLLDVRDLAPALGPGSESPRLVGTPAWGPGGLAFVVRAGNQLAVFVRGPEGRIAEALQEPYLNPHRVPHVAWAPDGDVLAIADDVGPSGAVLRTFDPSSGELRAVSLAPVGFAGIAWAPDGESIALLTGAEQLVVARLDGTWLLRRATDWDALLGWSPGR